ncbi:MAG: hypothetical protein P857_762 [Candidatus Xenolissoclinum pacificiensis L6]|uniref:Uncharacterized protein n=1 Tax=Candidatus Xenolissoclinum pacificiensis L6 TaxID=1401685 RepID=W2V0U7_9RICK|nr:MAG: hypothetical protein P857_762 [Candidatus Xenolissoclinum pacificiensis L6]
MQNRLNSINNRVSKVIISFFLDYIHDILKSFLMNKIFKVIKGHNILECRILYNDKGNWKTLITIPKKYMFSINESHDTGIMKIKLSLIHNEELYQSLTKIQELRTIISLIIIKDITKFLKKYFNRYLCYKSIIKIKGINNDYLTKVYYNVCYTRMITDNRYIELELEYWGRSPCKVNICRMKYTDRTRIGIADYIMNNIHSANYFISVEKDGLQQANMTMKVGYDAFRQDINQLVYSISRTHNFDPGYGIDYIRLFIEEGSDIISIESEFKIKLYRYVPNIKLISEFKVKTTKDHVHITFEVGTHYVWNKSSLRYQVVLDQKDLIFLKKCKIESDKYI